MYSAATQTGIPIKQNFDHRGAFQKAKLELNQAGSFVILNLFCEFQIGIIPSKLASQVLIPE
jgi:hypothetical protein